LISIIPLIIALNVVTALVFLRRGLLTVTAAIFTGALLYNAPLTTDFSAWYSGYTIAMIIAVLILAGWAFHTSLGGRSCSLEVCSRTDNVGNTLTGITCW
jgi:hypothetical protein